MRIEHSADDFSNRGGKKIKKQAVICSYGETVKWSFKVQMRTAIVTVQISRLAKCFSTN